MTEPIVRLEHISKSFAGVPALADVSFELRGGEVHALLGENGAGKSTLMKILSGVYLRDEGRMTVLGREVGDLTPKGAKELGIAIIHQELNLCTHLTVAENIFLGREVVRGGRLADREMNDRATEILERLNIAIPPTTPVGDLPVSKQQMVEIARALSEDARILIMDEPTSALTSREIDDLFAIIRTLRASGRGIVYISHRLEELRHIVDRVTVLRDGRWITTLDFADTSLPELIAHMVGREITEQFPRVRCPKGKKILEVRGLSAGRAVRDVGFELHEGEIVGVAGLMGAGRTEMTRAIFGADPRDGGEILLDGEPVKIEKPLDAIEAGIVLAPEDRKKDGLCTRLSVRENIALPNLDAMAGGSGVVDRGKERRTTDDTVRSLRVRLASPEQAAESLSGGNQQKVVIGKWLARNSRVVLFDEPTRGIDVAAKTEIYNLMNDLKQRGIGVLFVSSEMPEVLGVSDRVLVMCGGRITGDFPVEEATQERILECATRFTA